jgi:hypothetical protein
MPLTIGGVSNPFLLAAIIAPQETHSRVSPSVNVLWRVLRPVDFLVAGRVEVMAVRTSARMASS